MIKIELCNGGPADGSVQSAPDETETIMVYTLVENPGKWVTERPATGTTSIAHVYKNAKRVSRNGNRVFDYIGKARA